MDDFLARLKALPAGYSEVAYHGHRYGLTISVSPDGRRLWLYAEELGGQDRVSCNIYTLGDGRTTLRPCEMPGEKVICFILELREA